MDFARVNSSPLMFVCFLRPPAVLAQGLRDGALGEGQSGPGRGNTGGSVSRALAGTWSAAAARAGRPSLSLPPPQRRINACPVIMSFAATFTSLPGSLRVCQMRPPRGGAGELHLDSPEVTWAPVWPFCGKCRSCDQRCHLTCLWSHSQIKTGSWPLGPQPLLGLP